ncbi:MAG: chemotaxis protein CheW [Rubrivivax sp.]
MANRQALRELHARLAERLQSVQGTEAPAAWLAVECEHQGLLFPLATAGEIFSVPTLLPVPHTRPWFIGVANLRGRLHGVADLAAFLGLRSAHRETEPMRDQARVLALNPALGSHCALLVDRLAGLRNATQLQPEPAGHGGERPAFAPQAWRDAGGRRWQEIDLAALAAHPQFLGIAG